MIAAAAALLLAVALPVARAQYDPQAAGVTYAACMDSQAEGLEAIVPFTSPEDCDAHCQTEGYLYAFYQFPVTGDICGCRLYGPTATEWRGSDNSFLGCAAGQWAVSCLTY